MGMVIVVGSAYFPADPSPGWEHYDALPDPLGWLLVLSGVFALARTDDAFDTEPLAGRGRRGGQRAACGSRS